MLVAFDRNDQIREVLVAAGQGVADVMPFDWFKAKPNFAAFLTQAIDMIPARSGALSTRLPTRPPAG